MIEEHAKCSTSKDGVSVTAKIEQLEAVGQFALADQLRPKSTFPAELVWLWVSFWELCWSRQYTMGGPQSLQYSEILAYAQLTGHSWSLNELEVIRQLDTMYLGALHRAQDKGSPNGGSGTTNKKPGRRGR